MSISVKYNIDGTFTVECGGESVVVTPANGPYQSSPIPQPKSVSSSSSNPLAPARPGPPRVGPRVMLRLPGETKPPDSAIVLTEIVPNVWNLADCQASDPDNSIHLKITPDNVIGIGELLNQVQASPNLSPKEVHLWLMPKDFEL